MSKVDIEDMRAKAKDVRSYGIASKHLPPTMYEKRTKKPRNEELETNEILKSLVDDWVESIDEILMKMLQDDSFEFSLPLDVNYQNELTIKPQIC